MNKKIVLIIVTILIVVIAAGTGVVTYAVWDGKKEDLSIGFSTGSDLSIVFNQKELDKSQSSKNFRPSGPLANNKSINEIIVRHFDITLKQYDSVNFTVGDIMMKESNSDTESIANAYMAVTVYKVDTSKPLTDSVKPENVIAVGQLLYPGVSYVITFKFTVSSDSELLSLNMQKAKISAMINFTGNNTQQGGNV